MRHRDEVIPPLASIERFSRQGATGELVWSAEGLEAQVYLQRGRIAWATSSRSTFSFAGELARRSNVDPVSLRAAVERSRRERLPLGRALSESGLVPMDVVREVLRLQIVAALASLGGPSPAPAEFVARDGGTLSHPEELTFTFAEVAPATRQARRSKTLDLGRIPPNESIPTTNTPTTTTTLRSERDMANLKDTLAKMMEIDGAMGCCAVDSNSGMMLGSHGGNGINLEVASAGNTEVVRAKRKTMKALGLNDTIDDILITLGKQYHIIRPLASNDALFVYLVLDKGRGNLAMARHQLTALERDLTL